LDTAQETTVLIRSCWRSGVFCEFRYCNIIQDSVPLWNTASGGKLQCSLVALMIF